MTAARVTTSSFAGQPSIAVQVNNGNRLATLDEPGFRFRQEDERTAQTGA